MSPTQRSMAALKAQGYTVAITERWNPHARIRQDLLGFIDLIAIKAGERGVLAVQTTSGDSVSKRIAKIRLEARAGIWLANGNRIVVHGWAKRGGVGKRKLWTCREVVFEPGADTELSQPNT